MKKMMQRSLAAVFICVFALLVFLCSGQRPAEASTCGYPNGPKSGTMIVDVNEYKSCSTMASLAPPGLFWAQLSNMPAGAPFANGNYGGYCVDLTGYLRDNPMFGNIVYTIDFWSSLDPNLPNAIKTLTDPVTKISYTIPWDKINYLLNTYPNENWLNLQAAYWDLVHNCNQALGSLYTCDSLRPAPYYFPYGPAAPYGCSSSNPPLVDIAQVQTMVNDANINGIGFVPKAGDRIASAGQITNCTPTASCRLPYQVIFVPTTCPTCTGSVGDRVWMDKNADGYQDADEPGISGVEVILTGIDAYGQTINLTTTTDANGNYQFSQLCTGDYKITVTKPADYSTTIIGSANGDDNIAYDSNDPAGTTFKITTDTSSNLSIDFGYVPVCSGSIGDLVWKDLDANGMQDGSDPVLSGVILELSGTNTYGQTITKTATTNSLGIYSFDALCQGTYDIKVVSGVPAGFSPTAPLSSNGNDLLPNDSNNPGGTSVTLSSDKDANPTVDFGYTPKCQGTIGNFIWKDLNENGLQDLGEPGIENAKVSLGGTNVYGQLISMTVYTDANGFYQFDGLCQSGANGYNVTVDPTTVPAGWIPTAPLNPNGDILDDTDSNDPKGTIVNLSGDSSANITVDFGYIPDCKATIGNFVWEDKNGDGVQNDLNSGIFGVEVFLTGTNDYGQPVNLSSISSASGYYEFTGLCKGNYTVAVNADSSNYLGLVVTSPVSSNGNDNNDSDSNNPVSTAVTLSDDATPNQTVDFGYIKLGRIGDFVWEDKNNNGIQDIGEMGIANVKVDLFDCAGKFIATTNTDVNGKYNFSVAPGSYYVVFSAPGYTFTTKNAPGSTTANDSNADMTGKADCITVASGETNNTIDAGLYKNATIGDFVWNDFNNNGIQDAGEPGLSDVTVTLFKCDGTMVATTTTDTNGLYSFTVAPGSYYVVFSAPGYSFTTINAPGSTSANDSNADMSGKTGCITVASGETNYTIDAGLYKGCVMCKEGVTNMTLKLDWRTYTGDKYERIRVHADSLTGQLLYDSWNDGNTDPGLPVGAIFSFNVPASAKQVVVTVQGKYHTVETIKANFSAECDLTIGTINGNTYIKFKVMDAKFDGDITCAPSYAKLGDYVWNDLNKDGLQDINETGISGITVNLYACSGTSPVATTSTDASGKYLFSSLNPEDYKVQFVLPSGYAFSPKDQGFIDASDSDVDPSGYTVCTSLTAGENDLTWDAGMYIMGDAGCTYTQGFWKNHEESWPVTSLMLGTVTYTKVQLLAIFNTPISTNGLISLSHQLIAAKLNMLNGAALTAEIQNAITSADKLIGKLVVPPVGCGFLETAVTSNLEELLDTYNSGLAEGAPTHCTDEASVPCSGVIGDLVWNDLNGNGIQGSDESGISGLLITLKNNVTGATATDTTDSNGKYSFTGVCAGSYKISVATPAGMIPSPSVVPGSTTANDSNGSPATVTMPTDNYVDNSIDFGFFKTTASCTGSIGDFVWNDQDKDGIQDYSEAGISEVEITLNNSNTGATFTAITNTYGKYKFANLCAGTYTLSATAPNGYLPTSSLKGTDRSKDSNGSPTTVVLSSNSSYTTTVDFGFFKVATSCSGSIGNLVWNDLNINGIQDTGETGIADVQVTLKNETTGVTASKTTDSYGKYLFTGLCAGTYTVSITKPVSYSASPTAQGTDRSKDSNANPMTGINLDENNTAELTIDFGFYKTPSPIEATGCSPGYWKNHANNWPSAYETYDHFESVFNVEDELSFEISLLKSLSLGGGGLEKLARQGTAALLNAKDIRVTGFPLTVSEVMTAVKNAIVTGIYEPLASQLDTYNNLGCPLN